MMPTGGTVPKIKIFRRNFSEKIIFLEMMTKNNQITG